MTWVKIDDQFFRNRKAREAGKDGRALFFAGLCYCASELTDGIILRSVVPVIAAEAEVRQKVAELLVKIGLWHTTGHACPDCEQPPAGAYIVHAYLEYQEPAEAVRERRTDLSRKRADAGRKGAERRWAHGNSHGNRDGKSGVATNENRSQRTNNSPSDAATIHSLDPAAASAEPEALSGSEPAGQGSATHGNRDGKPDGNADGKPIATAVANAWQTDGPVPVPISVVTIPEHLQGGDDEPAGMETTSKDNTEPLARRLAAICTGTRRPTVQARAAAVIAWATQHLDDKLVDECIGRAAEQHPPPVMPDYVAAVIEQRAGDLGIRIPPYRPTPEPA